MEFSGGINVLGLDLDTFVSLEPQLVEFRDNEQVADRFGLDKDILVTVYNFSVPNKTPAEIRQLVGKYLYAKLAELVDYDPSCLKLQYRFSSNALF